MTPKKKYKKKSEINNLAKEPADAYTIKFCSSFEEMNEAEAMEMAMISPLQHLKNATALIKNIYAIELKNKIKYDTIYFVNHE
ncbi:MAG: hypothetical protein A2275_05355 [Bacteroidetes bacterium RIFOXYA12_FULL_35_11]|nr:MAG: hypothetical protein A2X01_19130 [Bacteroidetes bacterium GWF2_35_48]OFY74302.1 MAG: hypothetical protein A2275_05355 [Bacteroidetes bacterium RIFOXYA12_FULL_35_11]OFY93572.1 MAG: hypothetical protein A2491_00800 [Bacteroidetes bacterium RIFOXYC12_FULL_35_7]HBX50720.1 hypothetical protein [Bacteroidales bacterium]